MSSTAQKIKFFIKDFFSKCDQIQRFLRSWSHLPKKSLLENFIFCVVITSNIFDYRTYFLFLKRGIIKSIYSFSFQLASRNHRKILLQSKFRSSNRRCFERKDVLRNFAKLSGKTLCQGLLFDKDIDLRPASLLKKRLWHRCFPTNFAKFLRKRFLQNASRQLLLEIKSHIFNKSNQAFSKIR